MLMRSFAVAIVVTLCLPFFAFARDQEAPKPKQAIVLAAFGSTQPQARKAYEAIQSRLETALPGLPVRLALTSLTARAHAGQGQEQAASPLTMLGQLSDQGYNDILVLPLFISAGEEYQDLKALVDALDGLRKTRMNKRPFLRVRLERALLGDAPDGVPADMAETAKALAGDAALAREQGAALVYAAHGNGKWQARVALRFQDALRKAYPGQTIAVATLESTPGLADVEKTLSAAKVGKVLLLPLLMTSGLHVAKDVCGQDQGSWRTALEQAGYAVDCRARGLGEVDALGDLFVRRAKLAPER